MQVAQEQASLRTKAQYSGNTFAFANLATDQQPLLTRTIGLAMQTADFIGIESGIDAAGAPAPFIAGMRGSFYICSDGIPGRYARRLTAQWTTAIPLEALCK